MKERFSLISQILWTPKIPVAFLESAKKQIGSLKAKIATLIVPSKCKSLQEILHLDINLKKIHEESKECKKSLANQLLYSNINLNSELKFFDKVHNISVETVLSTLFTNELEIPLNTLMQNEIVQLEEIIQKNYATNDFGGIGDCLFRALTQVSTVEKSRPVRLAVVNYMSENRAIYEPLIQERLKEDDRHAVRGVTWIRATTATKGDFECYLEWMKADTSFGGEPEIQAYSDMTKTPLLVHHKLAYTAAFNFIQPKEESANAPIPFVNQGQNHFVSLFLHTDNNVFSEASNKQKS